MNLLILATVIAISSAAQLPSRNYIPQNQGGGQGGQGGYSQGGGQGQYQGGSGGGQYQGGSGGGQYQGAGGFGGSGGGFGGSGGNGNTRPQQQQEKNAAILKQDQAIDDSGSYHFGYETENGIRAEEQGNPSDAQGGFSYKGDDGQTYTVTYTSGEGGFRPQGEHLPVAPPTPEAILEALQQNAKDEAAGIFDDGQYKADVHGGPGGNKPGYGNFGGNGNRPGNGGGNGNRPGNGGGNGNHQNGFNANSGYTY